MRYNRFGSTGIEVSEVGFGCARLGGILAQSASKREPQEALQCAFDQGVTFFDTADMYAQGESETLLGAVFHGRRDKVFIASKGGYCLPGQRKLIARIKPLVKPLVRLLGIKRQSLPAAVSGSMSQNFSAQYLIDALEASLRRLKTDYIDLYQVHSPPTAVIEQGEFIETLEKLKQQGKIRLYGVAADNVEDARLSLKYPGVSSLMFPFGLLDQEAKDSLLAQAEAQGVALIGRGCFGGGLLKPSLSETELQAMTAKWPQIMAIRNVAAQQGRSVPELALQFSRHFASVSVHLLGMRTSAHVLENLSYLAASSLSAEELNAISNLPPSAPRRTSTPTA